jgi:hypothetical protein
MIDHTSKNYTIDFNNNRFILFDNTHHSEQIISVDQAAKFKEEGLTFTAISKDELEEAQYDEAIAHYLGDDETYSQTSSKAKHSL